MNYAHRLITVALVRYIYRDMPIPVDLEAALAAEGVIVSELYEN